MAPTSTAGALALALSAVLCDSAVALRTAPRQNASLLGARGLNSSAEASSSPSHSLEAQPVSLHAQPVSATSGLHAQPVSLPKVFFLFMGIDRISNLQVWNDFFASAPPSQYRALVHCKNSAACGVQLKNTMLELVPTVPSYYCTDLVSPMQQLVAVALEKDGKGNPMDKFAFVSDSTLPAKPFTQIYTTLVARQGSDFCVFPSVEWADRPGGGHLEMAPKHHQWITLSRQHADKTWRLWSKGWGHDFMTKYRMNSQGYTWMNNSFADSRNFGCLDEFWHFIAIFGPVKQAFGQGSSDVYLPDFVGGPLAVAPETGWQGTCDTFVIWAKFLNAPSGTNQAVSPFRRFHAALDAASAPHGGNNQRPGWWDRISKHGLKAIRESDFLFVRKFIDKPALADGGDFGSAYVNIVFGA